MVTESEAGPNLLFVPIIAAHEIPQEAQILRKEVHKRGIGLSFPPFLVYTVVKDFVVKSRSSIGQVVYLTTQISFSNSERIMLRSMKSTLFVLLLLSLCGIPCLAQERGVMKIDATQAGKKDEVLREIQSGTVNRQRVEQFLVTYYLARWTHLANAKDLHNYRLEMAGDIAKLPDAGKKSFMDILASNLTKIAANNSFYPACRYNAVLAIAEMNIKEGARDGAPVPYVGVLKRLCDFCDSDKVVLPDYVRLGALVGVIRHTELGIADAANRTMVQTMLLKLLSPQYIQEKHYRPEVMSWFELKAMEGLTNLKTPAGPKGPTETLDALRGVIEQKSRSLDVRCLAARGIAAMDLTTLKGYDTVGLAKSVAMLAKDFCEADLKFIDEEAIRDQIKSGNSAAGGVAGGEGGPGGGGPGGGGPGMGAPADAGMMPADMGPGGGMPGAGGSSFVAPTDPLVIEKIENVIARVKFDFDSVLQAINGTGQKTGVKAVLTDKEKDATELLNKISGEIKKTYEFLDGGASGPAPAPKKARGAKKKQAAGPSGPRVDIPLIKDHLEEELIRYKEILGVDIT